MPGGSEGKPTSGTDRQEGGMQNEWREGAEFSELEEGAGWHAVRVKGKHNRAVRVCYMWGWESNCVCACVCLHLCFPWEMFLGSVARHFKQHLDHMAPRLSRASIKNAVSIFFFFFWVWEASELGAKCFPLQFNWVGYHSLVLKWYWCHDRAWTDTS